MANFEKNTNHILIYLPTYSKNDKFNHGIGLSNIKEVIEHYQGDIRYTVEKDIVCAEIVLFHVVMY